MISGSDAHLEESATSIFYEPKPPTLEFRDADEHVQ